MRVEQLLSETARRSGDEPAIVSGAKSHSYAEIDRKSDRLAAAFASQCVRRGDSVGAFLDDVHAAVVTAFAVIKAGAAFCPVDPATSGDDLAAILAASRAVGIVTEGRLASTAALALCSVPAVKLVVLVGGDRSAASDGCLSFEEAVTRFVGVRSRPEGEGHDPALIVCEAGPDGGAVTTAYTHDDLVAASADGDAAIAGTPPISTHAGFCRLLGAIRAGAPYIVGSRTLSPGPWFGLRASDRLLRPAFAR
jgi:acyl-CoA synthetase (AMP-forming)/AMP-acid ligase II